MCFSSLYNNTTYPPDKINHSYMVQFNNCHLKFENYTLVMFLTYFKYNWFIYVPVEPAPVLPQPHSGVVGILISPAEPLQFFRPHVLQFGEFRFQLTNFAGFLAFHGSCAGDLVFNRGHVEAQFLYFLLKFCKFFNH